MRPYYILLFALIGIFLLRYPRAQVRKYIERITYEKKVHVSEFWKFRELVSPGNFTFQSDGLSKKNPILPIIDQNAKLTLRFQSSKIKSMELLTKKSQFGDVVKVPRKGEIFFKNDVNMLVRSGDAYYLVYMQTIPELLTVNGWYKYPGEHEKMLVSYKNAVTVARINVQ